MQRRQFVQTVAAGSALGTLGLVSGCASTGGNGPHVVVVGGGYGGATAAKYLRLWGRGWCCSSPRNGRAGPNCTCG